MKLDKVFSSSLGIKYPTYRDHPLHSGSKWLEGKQKDDGAEGYWRVHDGLYDMSSFAKHHPGGRDWIELTKGTDITEAFESHHITPKAKQLLSKYFLRKTTSPRTFPFTFHEDGFYRTLKRNVAKELDKLPSASKTRSKFLIDGLLAAYICTFIMAMYHRSFAIGLISGIFLGLVTLAAHNFFHQKDNFRRFYFDLSMMSSKEWRISHVLSHHMYPNTITDLEISSFEPLLWYLPGNISYIRRFGSWIISPAVYSLLTIYHFFKTVIQHIMDGGKDLTWTFILPFVVPFLSWIITKESIGLCIEITLWVVIVASFHFSLVGLNAAHHHPDLFHDGDASRPKEEMDWGVFELDAVADRADITGSHFLVLTNFGDHALHHLFPTLDHGLLEYLYPIFLKTCQEFGIEWKYLSQIEMIKGQFLQIIKRDPTKQPPKSLKKGKKD